MVKASGAPVFILRLDGDGTVYACVPGLFKQYYGYRTAPSKVQIIPMYRQERISRMGKLKSENYIIGMSLWGTTLDIPTARGFARDAAWAQLRILRSRSDLVGAEGLEVGSEDVACKVCADCRWIGGE